MEGQGIFKNISDETEGVISVRKYKPGESPSRSVKIELESFPDAAPEPSPASLGQPPVPGSSQSIEDELSSVLSEILTAVKETMQARTAAFAWASGSKKKFFIAACQTDSPDFISEKWLGFSSDVLTQIYIAANAQLYTEISAADEPALIRYYAQPNGIRSFMGVPVFHQGVVYAIVFVDSVGKAAYSPDDVKLLNRFGKICSSLIDNYAVKAAGLEEVRFVKPAINLMHLFNRETELGTLLSGFCTELGRAVEPTHLVVALLNSQSELVVRKSITRGAAEGNRAAYIAEGSRISLSDSAVGAALTAGEAGTIDDLSTLKLPRFFTGEPTPSPAGTTGADGAENTASSNTSLNGLQGAMLIVPIKFGDLTAGVIVLESETRRYFNRENFQKVRFFAEALSLSLHTLLLSDTLKAATPLDEETGTLSKRTFVGRVRNELNRAMRDQSGLSLMLIEFDDQAGLSSRYGRAGLSFLMRSTARLIGANVRSYDLLARFGTLKFAVALMNISEINTRFWAEKIREQIVNFPFETEDEYKTILASVSIGIARLRADQPDIDILFEGAEAALQHALASGGNTIKVY